MNSVQSSPVKVPLSERINLRLITFIALITIVVGVPVYWYLDSELTGGIRERADGYTEVDLRAMSLFSFDQQNGRDEDVPAQFRKLDGKKVILTGEMWVPGSFADRVKDFQLCYSVAKCCFSGPPQVQHFVNSTAPPGKAIPVYSGLVEVAGTLRVKVKPGPEGKVASVYEMDVERVNPL